MARWIALTLGPSLLGAALTTPVDAGEVPFSTERLITTVADNVLSVATGDLDGDGDIDLASASSFDDTIAWYDNQGDATFVERIISTTVDGANDVVIGDLDRDGDADIVASAFNETKISWFENVPSSPDPPSFVETQISPGQINGFNSVGLLDHDRDGDLDIVGLDNAVHGMLYTQQSVGAFTASVLPLFGSMRDLAVGDVDGDGREDLMISTLATNQVQWLRNLGGGSFETRSDSTTEGTESIAFGDLDSNARPDFVTAAGSSNDLDWHRNGGPNGFVRFPVATSAIDPQSVELVDLDQDGDLDILAASAGDETVSWFEHVDQINPIAFVHHPIGTTSINAVQLTSADLDADGDLDVIAVSSGDDTISWFENRTPRGTVLPAEEIPIESAHGGAVGVALGDLDRDGFMDIVGSFGTDDALGNRVRWYSGASIGPAANVAVGVEEFVRGVNSVELHDLDGDGRLDVLTAAPLGAAAGGGDIAWHQLDPGGGSFTHHRIHENATLTRHATAGDLDGDGDLDVVSAVGGESSIYWYLNDGTGVFSAEIPATTAGTVPGVRSVDIGDIDRDGDLDIAFAATGEGEVGWLENDGGSNPVFTRRDLTIPFSAPFWIEIGDVNGDGRPDLVASSVTSGQVRWFRNAGGVPTTFDLGFNHAGGLQGATGLALADVDSDGDLDVTVTARNVDRAVWLENPGGPNIGILTRRPLPAVLDGALAVAVGDRLRDGIPDLVVACESNQGLVLIPNARAVFWDDFERGDAAVWSAEVP